MTGAFVALMVLVVLPPTAWAEATTEYRAASLEEKMSLRGTHGFDLTLTVSDHDYFLLEAEKRVGARGKRSATYITAIPKRSGNRIEAKIGRLGRIDVDFVRDSSRSLPALHCRGAGTREKGHFVGLIAFRGARGFTRVRRRVTAGTVTRRAADTCPDLGPSRGLLEDRPGIPRRLVYLLAGKRSFSEGVEAYRLNRGGGHAKKGSYFHAYSGSNEHGLYVLSSATVEVPSLAPFVVPSSATPPEEATLRPPAPFTGSATFRLLAPTRARWTGDLAARLPGLGVVRLVRPYYYVGLCREKTCTETLPQGLFLEEGEEDEDVPGDRSFEPGE
jgi:hypothetical protein